MPRMRWRAILAALLAGLLSPSQGQAGGGGEWRRLPDLVFGTVIAQAAATTMGGRIYVMTNGFDPYYAGLHAYEVHARKWVQLAPPITGSDTLVGAGDRLYALGEDTNVPGEDHGGDTGIYTVRTGTWAVDERHPNDPATIRRSHCAHAYGAAAPSRDGHVYSVAGDASELMGGCLEAFDPARHAWALLAPLPHALYQPAAATGPDGRIYVLGGVDERRQATRAAQAYDPATNRWAALAPMPTARAALAAVAGPDGRIYAIGGSPDAIAFQADDRPPRSLAVVEAYDPRTDRWAKVASLHVPRYQLGATLGPDGAIYVIGGHNTNAVETYQVSPLPPQ